MNQKYYYPEKVATNKPTSTEKSLNIAENSTDFSTSELHTKCTEPKPSTSQRSYTATIVISDPSIVPEIVNHKKKNIFTIQFSTHGKYWFIFWK